MDILSRAQRIAERLKDGRLLQGKSVKLWAGFGNGRRVCDGCGDRIESNEVEHEHDLESGGVVRFHAACSVLWERMSGQRQP